MGIKYAVFDNFSHATCVLYKNAFSKFELILRETICSLLNRLGKNNFANYFEEENREAKTLQNLVLALNLEKDKQLLSDINTANLVLCLCTS